MRKKNIIRNPIFSELVTRLARQTRASLRLRSYSQKLPNDTPKRRRFPKLRRDVFRTSFSPEFKRSSRNVRDECWSLTGGRRTRVRRGTADRIDTHGSFGPRMIESQDEIGGSKSDWIKSENLCSPRTSIVNYGRSTSDDSHVRPNDSIK